MTPPRARLLLCAVMVALGLSVLLGWFGHIEVLKSALPGGTTMKINTSIAFVLAGTGLASTTSQHPLLRRFGAALGISVAVLGALTLLQFIAGINLGLDELFIRDGALGGRAYPGRMSPLTACAWIAQGAAIALLALGRVPRMIVIAHFFAGIIGFIAFFAAAGYAFGAHAFGATSVSTTMALHTALGLMLASSATLMTRAEEGWLRDFTGSPATSLMLGRLLRIALVLPFALGLVLLLGSGLGLFNAAFGFALFAPCTALALVWLALRVARAARRDEEEMREREERLSAFIAQSTAGFAQTDLSGRFTLVNDRFCEIAGRSREDLLGRTMQEITHSEDLPANLGLFEAAVTHGTPYTHEKRYVRPDGSNVWVNNSVSVIRRPSGEPYGVLAVSIDITERRKTEAAVRENEARLRALTDNLPGGLVYQISTGRTGKERRFLFMSSNHEQLTGYPAEAVLADSSLPYNLILPEDRPRLAAAEAHSLEARAPFDIEARVRRADGEVRWFRIVSAPREQPDGSLIWDGLQIDITREKDAEAALRKSEERLATALTIARVGIYDWNVATGEVTLDENARELFDVSPDTAGFAPEIFNRVDPCDQERVRQTLRMAQKSFAKVEMEYGITVSDGSHRVLLSMADAVPGPDGKAERVLGILADITERKRFEEEMQQLNQRLEERVRERTQELERVHEQLRQSQKLEAIGQLTGGVAHDFNNLLTPIIGSLDLLQHRAVGTERDQRLINAALESAERARTLVQRLLAFARRQPLRPGPVKLDKLVGGMAELIGSTSGPQIRLVTDVPADLPPALADANQLEMAILNLAVNARDAMPDGGVLSFAAAAEEIGADHPLKLHPGRYLRLAIADTGTGMDEETSARAIEPFFSTKGIGKGTGLGLSMVHGLASQLGGTLQLASKPGLGTTVTLLLPCAEEAQSAAPASLSRTQESPRAGDVLVVDDEAGARELAAEMLRDLGYAVTEAASAEEALALLRDHPFDLLLTDHLMPGMNGAELVRHVRLTLPSMPALIVSGYADLDEVSPDLDRLAKPFRREELERCLATLARKAPPLN